MGKNDKKIVRIIGIVADAKERCEKINLEFASYFLDMCLLELRDNLKTESGSSECETGTRLPA